MSSSNASSAFRSNLPSNKSSTTSLPPTLQSLQFTSSNSNLINNSTMQNPSVTQSQILNGNKFHSALHHGRQKSSDPLAILNHNNILEQNPIYSSTDHNNLKEALRVITQFSQKTLQKLEESLIQLSRFKDKDEKIRIIEELNEQIEVMRLLLVQVQQKEIQVYQQKQLINDNLIEEIQSQLNFQETERQLKIQDYQMKLETQCKMLAQIMRENESLKQECSYNKSLLAQTQAQLQNYCVQNNSENFQLNTSGDINLGDSRLDTNLNQQDIDNLVILQQSQINIGSTNNFQKRYLNQNNTSMDQQESILPEGYLFKATQITDQPNQSLKNEVESLRNKVQEYQQNYIKKDYLFQLVDRLQSTFQSIEFDASSIKDLIQGISNQTQNLSLHQSMDSLALSQSQPSQQIQQQLSDNFDLLSQRIQNAFAMNIQQQHSQTEIIELKTEICEIKKKLLQTEQKRIEDLNAKNMFIQKLEQQLSDEQRRRIEEMDEKEKKIEELEREIESTIEQQINENQNLRDKNDLISTQVIKYNEIEKEIIRYYGDQYLNFKKGDLTFMVQKLVNDNENLKQTLEQRDESVQQVIRDYEEKFQEKERQYLNQKRQLEQDHAKIIKDFTQTHNQQLSQRDHEIHQLKTKMATQIDQISLTLDDNLAQNRELNQQVKTFKNDLNNKEIKEKQLLAKIMKLREDRSQYRQQQQKLQNYLLEISEYVLSIENGINLKKNLFKETQEIDKRKYDTNQAIVEQIQQVKDSLKIINDQVIEDLNNKNKQFTRNQSIQTDSFNQIPKQIVINQQQDHNLYYEEILRILKHQQNNSARQDNDSELINMLGSKLEEIKCQIAKQEQLIKSPHNQTIRQHQASCQLETHTVQKQIHMETTNQDGTTPKVKKSRSYLQLLNNNNNENMMRPFNMPLSSMNQQSRYNIMQENIIDEEDNNLGNYTQFLMQQEGIENHEELGNSKFWFDMYQRIKKEISKERKITLEAQSKLQEREDESFQLKQKLYLVSNENQTLEKLNAQYLHQIQDVKGQYLVKDKNKNIQEIEVIDGVIDEFQQVSKQLKGDFMLQLIDRLQNIRENYQNSENQSLSQTNTMETLQHESFLSYVLIEIMNVFKVLLKQLQHTMKELHKYKSSSNVNDQSRQYSKSPLIENYDEYSRQQQQYSKQQNNNQSINHQQNQSTQEQYIKNQKQNDRSIRERDNYQPFQEISSIITTQKFQQDNQRLGVGCNESMQNIAMTDRSYQQHQQQNSIHKQHTENIPPKYSNRKGSQSNFPSFKHPIDQNATTQMTQQSMIMNNMNQYQNHSHRHENTFQRFQQGQPLTERQRLELYELRTAAIREIEEAEIKGKEADPYLKKYVKSINDLLSKALSTHNINQLY
ncbi:UNKNOWN [Stylonychia lemnae]|uniref:Uncharacterized protein n=1 Tax=Stylonychia lemnae TaxID=5949 RepID=A0A078A0M1_STYLE|nr:UNKNOWN [Stylonychia lemnae]|eukprot:CDW75407.1 UNKNOWN [Stylonychia lemnae]